MMRLMRRAAFVSGAVMLALGMGLAGASQSGIPADLAGYRSWTRMNTIPLTDPSNPRAGPKNTFTNLSPAALRELVAAGGRVRAPFPQGTILVRESLDAAAGFVRVLFVQRKVAGATQTRGWAFSAFTRSAADQPFQPMAVPDPVARCLNCHAQVGAYDFVFTPFLNRPDRLPARVPTTPDRVEIFNNRFGPETLRVKTGASVVWANYDLVPHDVKAADRSFESGNLPLLGRYFVTFSRPGVVEYFCAVHLEMRARVIVEP